MQSKEKVPLRVELSGTEKYFYEKFSAEEACDWLEGFINGALLGGEKISAIIEGYQTPGVDSSVIGAIQRLIDTVRGIDSG